MVDVTASGGSAIWGTTPTAPISPAELDEALRRDRLEVHYQPVVVLPSRHVVGFEALARLRTADGALVAPTAFIPVAEQTGQILRLGEAVLRRALAEAAGWRQTDNLISTATIGVNVAVPQLEQPGFIGLVADALAANDLPGSVLVLEITETSVTSPRVRPVLERLSAMGVRVALDDFGVGFATLDNLRRLPVQVLKLDASFVGGVTRAGADQAIVRVVVDLADSLGLSVIAEGVETEEQVQALLRLGCPAAQGYLFARPDPDPAAAAASVLGREPAADAGRNGEEQPWPVEVDIAVLAAVRLLAIEPDPHRAAVHALATGLARVRGLPEPLVRAVGRLALVHDIGRLRLDGAPPIAGEPRLAALAGEDGVGCEEVRLVRAAVGLACAAGSSFTGPAASGLSRHLFEAAARVGESDPDLAASIRELAADPPEVAPLADLIDDLDRRRLGRRGMEERLRSLVGISRALASSRDNRELLKVALEEVRRIVGAASASLERWERESGHLRCLVNVGQLGPWEEPFPEDETYPLADYTQARHTLLTGLPYVHTIDDPDAPPEAIELLTSLQKYSSAAVPVYLEGRLWGQLWLASGVGEPPFVAADIEMLTAIATLMGGVVAQAENLDRVARLAFEDPLTRVGNRRAVDDALARMAGECTPVVATLLDVDLLKQINDTEGHARGDEALTRVADSLSVGLADLAGASVGRLGGDEFCVLLPNVTPAEARRRIQSILSALVQDSGGPRVSMGMAVGRPGWQPRELLAAADADLYQAKRLSATSRAGRSRLRTGNA